MRGEVNPADSANHLSGKDVAFPFQLKDANVLSRLEWIGSLYHVRDNTTR